MPDLDAALKKVIIGVSIVTAAATVAAFIVFSKASSPSDRKRLKSQSQNKERPSKATASNESNGEAIVVSQSAKPLSESNLCEKVAAKEEVVAMNKAKEVVSAAAPIAAAPAAAAAEGKVEAATSNGVQDTKQKTPSWSDIVEEDIKQESVSESHLASKLKKMEISEPKPVPSSSGDSGRKNDSGVASPNDNVAAAAAMTASSSTSAAAAAAAPAVSPSAADNKRRRHREETAPDGGLGSDGEDQPAAPSSSVVAPETSHKSSGSSASTSKPVNPVAATNGDHNPRAEAAAATDSSATNGGSSSVNDASHVACCDSGQGSEPDDGIRLAYHFYIPHYLCGKFIGLQGNNIRNLKLASKCSVQLRQTDENGHFKSFQRGQPRSGRAAADGDQDSYQVCLIEGTRSNIDHCLDLIRQRFPIDQCPELTLEQINLPSSISSSNNPASAAAAAAAAAASHLVNSVESNAAAAAQPLQLGLTQGAMHEVYVSNIVSGGHIFLQQPTHPTHASLGRLEQLMAKAYSTLSIPDIPREAIEPGLVCVAKVPNYQWYRVQVVSYDPANDSCDVKFVDYGGYFNFAVSDLKQIRTDFLTLPFQALECYLGNVIPPDGREWPVDSGAVLNEMVQNQIISGRMLGVNEECVPIVHLYGWVNPSLANSSDATEHEQQPRLLNRELVDRGVALWTEHVIAN